MREMKGGQESGMHASERSNMCKGLELKRAGPSSGNCGDKKKNMPMLEKGIESCLHLIIFQLTRELSRQPSSSRLLHRIAINVSASPVLE